MILLLQVLQALLHHFHYRYLRALEVIACDNADLDEYCDVLDDCPNDFENDADDDGVCGDIDICPHDPLNDIDGDGLCCGDANGDGVLSNDDGEEEEGECECYFNFFDCSGCCGDVQ